MFVSRRPYTSQVFHTHQRPVGTCTETVFDEYLDAARAAGGDAGHHGLGRMLSGVGTRRQRMLACVRGLVDVVRKDLVADVLVYEHQGITVDDGGCAAPKDVRVLLLGGERRRLARDMLPGSSTCVTPKYR